MNTRILANNKRMIANVRIKMNERMVDIIYPEFSYKVMGVLFRVHRKLGNSYQEKYYQRAVEIELAKESIAYQREYLIRLDYENQKIGKYFLDFVIEEKIALELKTVPFLTKEYLNQVLAYLSASNLKLGIVANFRTNRVTYDILPVLTNGVSSSKGG